jgi:hypothetical protein
MMQTIPTIADGNCDYDTPELRPPSSLTDHRKGLGNLDQGCPMVGTPNSPDGGISVQLTALASVGVRGQCPATKTKSPGGIGFEQQSRDANTQARLA